MEERSHQEEVETSSLVKSQQKSRSKRKQVVKELARDHPKIGYKLKKTSSKKATRAT